MQGNDITTYSFYLFGPPLSFRLSFERKDFCAERSLSLSPLKSEETVFPPSSRERMRRPRLSRSIARSRETRTGREFGTALITGRQQWHNN